MDQVYIYGLAIILFTNWCCTTAALYCKKEAELEEGRLSKAQRTQQGLIALTNVCAFMSYLNLIKNQLQNLDQTSASKSRSNATLKVLTKLQPENFDQISALKSWLKIYFKIWPNFSFILDKKSGSTL